jgi:hypothetical protein
VTVGEQVVERIEGAGGVLGLNGDRIRCRLPEEAAHLLGELRTYRNEVLVLLRRREETPSMPPGVRLIQWQLRKPPVAIETCAVVTDPALFASTTLEQLRLALTSPKRWVGWSVPQLIDRLAQVGVIVARESGCSVPTPYGMEGQR